MKATKSDNSDSLANERLKTAVYGICIKLPTHDSVWPIGVNPDLSFTGSVCAASIAVYDSMKPKFLELSTPKPLN